MLWRKFQGPSCSKCGGPVYPPPGSGRFARGKTTYRHRACHRVTMAEFLESVWRRPVNPLALRLAHSGCIRKDWTHTHCGVNYDITYGYGGYGRPSLPPGKLPPQRWHSLEEYERHMRLEERHGQLELGRFVKVCPECLEIAKAQDTVRLLGGSLHNFSGSEEVL